MTTKATQAEDLRNWQVQDLVFRVEGAETGDFISFEAAKCTGCGQCALVCAANMWSVSKEKKKARLSPRYRDLCLECAACYAVCEPDAIEFRYPRGGSGIAIQHG